MKNIKKYYIIPANPEEVYLALTQEATIQLWTGEPAVMGTEPGSEFSLWDDSISGINLSFENNHKIVQQWNFGEQDEPSIVTIKLHPDKHGTSFELNHTNIPDEYYDNILEGWNDAYIASLIEFYDEDEE